MEICLISVVKCVIHTRIYLQSTYMLYIYYKYNIIDTYVCSIKYQSIVDKLQYI